MPEAKATEMLCRGVEHNPDSVVLLFAYGTRLATANRLEDAEQHLEKVQFQLRFREYFDVLYVNYRDVLRDPQREAGRMNDFFGGQMDVDAMAAVVDPKLYRNRRGE